jgi:hypothetical protein
LALEIPPRLNPLKQPRAYSSLTKAECSDWNIKTDKDSISGKRIWDVLITWTKSCKRSLSSNRDKREKQDSENIIIVPPFFHINSCTVENNENIPPPLTVEEIRNLDLSDIDPVPTKIYDELNHVLGEARYFKHRSVTENAEAGPSNIRPQTMVEDDNELEYEEDPRSKQMSPALTENIHPGYPYRENIEDNDDLPRPHYLHLYLAAQVDYVSGEPRVQGKDEKGDIPYDERPLTAQPMEVVYDDIEDKVVFYPFGEDAYLDMDFLQAMGNIDDRGLAAEGLRLVQLQGEFRYLEQWQKCLETRERAIHLERGNLIQKKRATHT